MCVFRRILLIILLVQSVISCDDFYRGSIGRSAKRPCISYSQGDVEVSRPAGATRCTDGVKYGTE